MIKGLSDRRRLPRAGIIRLGIKKKHEKSGNEYPIEVDYFVCPELVQEKYGPQPKELMIMFPVESEEIFFQQFYKCYGKGILLCRGDGVEGTFWDFEKGDFNTRKCPCEKLKTGKCKPIGILQFLLPEIKEAVGAWQITTSSKNSIVDINSSIDFVRGIVGRVAMIPLLLKREPLQTHRIEGKDIKTGTHFTLKISLGMSLVEIQKLGQIPPARALLPMPDESQQSVNDLFPANGFKPEKEKEDEAPEPPEPLPPDAEQSGKLANEEGAVVGEGAFEKARDTLKDRMDDYVKKWGGVISMKTAEKVAKFTTFEEVSKEIDKLNSAIEEKKAKKKEKEFAGSEGELPF